MTPGAETSTTRLFSEGAADESPSLIPGVVKKAREAPVAAVVLMNLRRSMGKCMGMFLILIH
jgi:hypothetical protein